MSKMGYRLDLTDDEISLIQLGLGKAHLAQDILGEKLYRTLCNLEEGFGSLGKHQQWKSEVQSLNPMRLTFDDEQETEVTGGQP